MGAARVPACIATSKPSSVSKVQDQEGGNISPFVKAALLRFLALSRVESSFSV